MYSIVNCIYFTCQSANLCLLPEERRDVRLLKQKPPSI